MNNNLLIQTELFYIILLYPLKNENLIKNVFKKYYNEYYMRVPSE